VDLDGWDGTVEQLEQMLEDKIGMSMEDAFFLYGAKSFRKHLALKEYGLQPNSTIHVCVKQKGGCFIVTFTILTILFFALLGAPFTCGFSLCLFPFLLPLVFILPFCFL